MSNSSQKSADEVAVAGGIALPEQLDSIGDADQVNIPDDELSRQLFTLRLLHPEVELNFRKDDFASMDDATKRQLIDDFQSILRIEPLQTTVK